MPSMETILSEVQEIAGPYFTEAQIDRFLNEISQFKRTSIATHFCQVVQEKDKAKLEFGGLLKRTIILDVTLTDSSLETMVYPINDSTAALLQQREKKVTLEIRTSGLETFLGYSAYTAKDQEDLLRFGNIIQRVVVGGQP